MAKPVFVFAHGAGAPSTHPWMERWSARLEQLGSVYRFDYPYMQAGRRSPDKQERLIAAHTEALAAARKPRRPVVLIGKSMGSRIGCHVSLEQPVDGLICLGYPLQGMGKAGKLRDAVLKQLEVPILFVQGTRDNLCPLDLLAQVRKKMQAPSELFVVEAGNHSLEVTKTQLKATGETQDDVDDRILAAITGFLEGYV
jgi:predicted alpha/beta-hydrolase family hydrolase